MAKNANQVNLAKLIQYCMGYIKLINPAFARTSLSTDFIDNEILNPDFLQGIDAAGDDVLLPLRMEALYSYTPTDLPEEEEESFNSQKKLATRLEEIRAKYKVNEYTKQINLNFGFLDIEVPVDDLEEEDDGETTKKTKQSSYPLFSIPVNITSSTLSGEVSKYYLSLLDMHVIPNIGFLQPILGEDLFASLSEYINHLEVEDKLTLPLEQDMLGEVWSEIKSRLKLSKAIFSEESFSLAEFKISLGSKSNFFLAQDMAALAELEEEDISDTALSSWVSEEDMSLSEPVDEVSGELFFPFPYDKYQLQVLSIINNKASIVQGPPGTGKSQTIANILCHLAAKNKRVLFLSQKDQAIRGVKDTLKKLDVEYLYGYIPNRHSALYSAEDEKDGAAFALSGIQQHLSGVTSVEKVATPVNPRPVVGEVFSDAINRQRAYFELHEKVDVLAPYNLQLDDESFFSELANAEEIERLVGIKGTIEKLKGMCTKYVATHKDVAKWDVKYQHVNFSKDSYFNYLDKLIKEYDSKGFDRKGAFGRSLSNSWLKMRNRDAIKRLPREIFDEFNRVINSNESVGEKVSELKKLRDYCLYKDCEARIIKLGGDFDNAASELGLGKDSWKIVTRILSSGTSAEQLVASTLDRLRLISELQMMTLTNPNLANEAIYSLTSDRYSRIRHYLQNRINGHIITATQHARVRGTLQRISRALQKSKKAYKTFDQFKSDPENFTTLSEIIPIWMMDLEDVSRLIPLEKNMFDYIILDEASQCNLAYALPAMYRSQHVIFFGDTEQMRDSSIRFKTNRSMAELAQKYSIPEHLQIKSTADSVKSVMDIGLMCGFKDLSLLYHYRSPKELIGFSNENFYAPKQRRMEVVNSNYLVYKDTNKVMMNHVIQAEKKDDISDKANIAEAEYIDRLIRDLKGDPKNESKSIGVLTFFNEQAELLNSVIKDDDVKISVIEGIQGDERDIIIYSLVIDSPSQKRRYQSLTGEGGDINKELAAGRVNVAFSRARQQVHCVTSMPIHKWPDGIWIKRYLEYVEANGEVDFYDLELAEFDSQFEKEFYSLIRNGLGKEYIIQNQVKSCGFEIDFVVTDRTNGKKLAIECDGPTHFKRENPEIRVSGDYERQAVLESAGWTFYRVLYSDWCDEEIERSTFLEEVKNYFEGGNQRVFKNSYSYEADEPTNELISATVKQIDNAPIMALTGNQDDDS